MKTELRLRPHALIEGANVVEIWHDGQFIGEITGSDHRPGIRVLSKWEKTAAQSDFLIMEVRIHV